MEAQSISRAPNATAKFESKQLWLWVYEEDTKIRKKVYKSDMIWPNKQHEHVHICLGLESDNTQCVSQNMTVIIAEVAGGLYKAHRFTKSGTLIKLRIKEFNSILTQTEIEARANICNEACRKTKVCIIVGVLFGVLYLAAGYLRLRRWWSKSRTTESEMGSDSNSKSFPQW